MTPLCKMVPREGAGRDKGRPMTPFGGMLRATLDSTQGVLVYAGTRKEQRAIKGLVYVTAKRMNCQGHTKKQDGWLLCWLDRKTEEC